MMKKSIVVSIRRKMFGQTIVLLAGIALASALPYNGRIVGGTNATIEDYPFMLSLQYNGFHTCGASILNENTAITAQHCVHNRNAALFQVRAGSAIRNSGGVVNLVTEIINHPDYDTSTLDNDVTILKFSEPFTFGPTIQPIGLPDHLDDLAGGTPAVIAGWGTTVYLGTSPDYLLRADVPVIDRQQCWSWYGYTDGIDERQICAGQENYDACQGDSGGPLIQGGKNWGLVSWGYQCARFERPTVFASTAFHRQWIDQYL